MINKSTFRLFIILLGLSSVNAFTLKAQSGIFPKDITKMVCYLDGEIIYDPDSTITLEALESINQKDIDIHHFIKEETAVKLYGVKGKYGIYLLYTKNNPESIKRSRKIIYRYCSDFRVNAYLFYKKLLPNDSLIDCNALKPGELAAEFPGGMQGLGKYLSDRLKMPDDAKSNMISGKVTVGFIVAENGSISDIYPFYGKHLGCNLAGNAVNMMKDLPRMYPASSNGKPSKSVYMLTIAYKISDSEAPMEASN